MSDAIIIAIIISITVVTCVFRICATIEITNKNRYFALLSTMFQKDLEEKKGSYAC